MTEIGPAPQIPVPDVVEACELLLEQAKAGELIGLAYVATFMEKGITHAWTMATPGETNHLLSELDRLKLFLMLASPQIRENLREVLES